MTRPALSLIGSLIAACGLAAAGLANNGDIVTVQSPDGSINAALRHADDGGPLRFSIERNGHPIIEPSTIDVRLVGVGSLAAGATVQNVAQREVDETSDLPWGKTSRLRDHHESAVVRFKSKSGVAWDVELRVFNDGVAFRYGIPEQKGLREVSIEDENTEFRLAGEPTILYTTCDSYTTSHEALYERKPLADLPVKTLIDKPLVAQWPDGTAAAITEARLRDFAGMYLERPETGNSALRTRLSPLPGKTGVLVTRGTPCWSPWRVVLLADKAGRLIENNVLLCLNEPADGDFSWLVPGKTTFHWWNGRVEHGPPSTPESNFATHKKYIDFCARNNIEYHSVISVAGNLPWFVQGDPGFGDLPHADTDILVARPDIDLPRILEYAKEKGVGIRFWVHWKPLSEHLDEAFAQYERWGIRGLMVDFMDRDDQEMVEWQERCLQAAAKHKLHIQFHGSYKPTGEQRTFPNLFNREGVLNLEYLKWSDLCAPPHTVNVAYTRLLAGPVDYHLGGFRAVPRDEFQPRDLEPWVMGTRCNQLTLYVVFDNPMPMVADDPSAYDGQPGFDFVADVPTTWDETRFVAGEMGEYVVVARRGGNLWYLGGITNWDARQASVPLTFLGAGEFEATVYSDKAADGKNPSELHKESFDVTSKESLEVAFASGGGVAAVFKPK
ncbi:MAG: glycoside hydrolase family 97 protein [Planctomycetes bacterium]|nr:glycoside hydrolase family 97 protein [Planctomycetota bacterium]